MTTLRIKGKISLNEFWPINKGDADTTKLKLRVNSFEYLKDGKYYSTFAYYHTQVVTKEDKTSVIKYEDQEKQYITVRLQGIDATELHYKIYDPKELAKYKKNKKFQELNTPEYRQYLSETATVALVNYLKKYADSNNDVDCYFLSANLKQPLDVLDIYGRFVGDLFITVNDENINQWLLKENWVLPAYYNSMLKTEVQALDKLYKNAGSKKRINKFLVNEIKADSFDFKLRFRDPSMKPVFDPLKDQGKLIIPKLYRRICTYVILNKSNEEQASFKDYLKKSDKTDRIIFIQDFLKDKKKSYALSELYNNDKLEFKKAAVNPNDIIIVERTDPTAKLIKKEDNSEVKKF